MEVAVLAIGVDYFQVLSVFATTEINWPSSLRHLYEFTAIFSFDFLKIFPPACSLDVGYEDSWLAVELAPLFIIALGLFTFGVAKTRVAAFLHERPRRAPRRLY